MARGRFGDFMHRCYSFTRWRIMPQLGHEVMRHRSPRQMLSQWPVGEVPLGPRVCIFVHWDGAGEVRDHVLHHVRSLGEAGFSVVFVSNAGRLRPAGLEALKQVCAGVIVRRNIGYDFGAWREGLDRLALPRPDTEVVAIANDSVYGPLRPLSETMQRIDFEVADIWGCTDSWQSRYHLQSYMVVFGPRAIRSDAFRKFWGGVVPTWSKQWLIRIYEIGLTQAMLKAGFRCRAIWQYQDLVRNIDAEMLDDAVQARLLERMKARATGEEATETEPELDERLPLNLADPVVQARRRHTLRLRSAVVDRTPLNPTSDLWRQLLANRYPFIKRELLRDNPTHVPDVAEWRDAVLDVAARSLAPIERDLQRTLKDRVP